MSQVEVRKATGEDTAALIPVLARAFAPQPLTQWLLGSGRRSALRRGERLIELEFKKALPYDLTYTTRSLLGAALWHPPDKKINLWSELIWSINSVTAIGFGRRTLSHLVTGVRLALQEPRDPHFYLAILAVAPDAQGEGIGSMLMEPVLALCDEQQTPAYLVTDTEDAVRFYQRHGFKVKNEIPAFQADLTLYPMWRQPTSTT
jgi:ribosomal protein S18 acetylase RimI-like enzyme